MVERFAEEGAWVALTARDEERMESIAADLPGESLIVPANVRDRDAVERVLAETFDIFGRVDTLVNNAGVSQLGRHDERREIPETDPSDWETIITVNPPACSTLRVRHRPTSTSESAAT
jgi:3-oxoacyl-[acyl-carrier protein] reductase